jgi:tetratricopeptide (TPR) repeat protein
LRGVVRNASVLKLGPLRKTSFAQLASSTSLSAEEWSDEAYGRYETDHDVASAIKAFQTAGELSQDGIYSCRAVLYETNDQTLYADEILNDGKKCVSKEALTPSKNVNDLNGALSTVNSAMANVLNMRGVSTEAMNYAREATVLNPNNGFAFDALGDSLFYLQRYNEAVSAEKEAIRLTDGKYGYMHFRLGTAYFELEQWRSAQDSFELAWNQDAKNEAAAYNVALCLQNQGYKSDAALWYRRVLKINPNREDKDVITRKIAALTQ